MSIFLPFNKIGSGSPSTPLKNCFFQKTKALTLFNYLGRRWNPSLLHGLSGIQKNRHFRHR